MTEERRADRKDTSASPIPRGLIRLLLPIVAVLLVGLFVYLTADIWSPFLIGFAVAYLLDPLVTRLEERRVPRVVGMVLICLALVLGLVLLGVYVVPRAQGGFRQIAKEVPAQVQELKVRFGPSFKKFDAKYHEKIVAALDKGRLAAEENLPKLLSPVKRVLKRAFSSFVNFFVTIVSVISVPVFAFYLLKDMARVKSFCSDLIPHRHRAKVLDVVSEIDGVISAFVRGQLLVATILSAIYMIGLGIIGVPAAVLVGLFCGYANLIPYLGIATGIPLASVLAFLKTQDPMSVLWVLVLFGGAQFLEGTIISPYIVGESVGLHPVVMILALMIWGSFFGFVGLLVAIPATAAITVVVRRWYRVYRESAFFLGAARE